MIKVFFCADVHGSERCFRKFINAAKFYKVDVLILAGDITGKLIVPIIKESKDKYRANFLGVDRVVNERNLSELEKEIRSMGYYPYCTTTEEYEELKNDKLKIDKLFVRLMTDTIKGWIKLAEERLKNTQVKCFISPGNDDRFEIDPILESSDYIINPEEKVVNISNDHEMITLGWSNPTPWNCPRECSEDKLKSKIDKLASQVRDMKTAIFNFHCPPYGTKLDKAPELDSQLRPVQAGTATVSVGSKSVYKAIKEYQPLLGLHGHIHESRGIEKIGRTICINPGSEYGEGILRGVIITLEKGKIKNYVLTSG